MYEASTDGRVRSLHYKSNKILRQYINHDGYAIVHLSQRGKKINKLVSRVIAETFLDEWEPTLIVDHIDRDRQNNDLSNLRMVTSAQNNINRRKSRPVVSRISVDQFTENGSYLKTFASSSDAASNIAPGKPYAYIHIHQAIQRGSLAYGFLWKTHLRATDADLPGEVWKRYGTSGVYGSNFGRYKRWCGLRFTHVQTGADVSLAGGYPTVQVYGKSVRLHRIISELFLSPPEDPTLIINHKNGVKTDAAAENLEWVTQRENALHAHEAGLNKKSSKPVAQVDKITGEVIAIFDSLISAHKNTGADKTNISKCLYGRCKTTGGFAWRLV